MQSKKSILDELDEIDELLKLAEEKPEVKVKFEDTEVEKFIHECKITPGETKVASYIIYYNYKNWKKKGKKLIDRNYFFRQFGKHFKRVLIQGAAAYLVNPEPFDLTQEGFFRARAVLRRERYERQKKNKKK